MEVYFTGGLVGALHGHSIIPEKWKAVQDIQYLDKVADRLLAISEDRLEEDSLPTSTSLKLLNSPKMDDFNIDEQIEFIPLCKGKITFIDRQTTLTKSKYNFLLEVLLDNGQSILVSKLFDNQSYTPKINESNEIETLLQLATDKLKPKTLKEFKEFIGKQKKLPKGQLEIIRMLIKKQE